MRNKESRYDARKRRHRIVKIEISLLAIGVLILLALSLYIFRGKIEDAVSDKVPPVNKAKIDKTEDGQSEPKTGETDSKTGPGNNTVKTDSKPDSKTGKSQVEDSAAQSDNSVRDQDYVLAHPEVYPQEFADALKRNPEILDFVLHYPDAEKVAVGGLTSEEKSEDCPLLIQWDSRWGYASYGNNNIGISGCGPTCLSMVIYGLKRDESATPDVLAEAAMRGGYYVLDQGTDWSFMTEAPQAYGITVSQHPYADELMMKSCLDGGGLIITSMTPGDFTDNGHFIVVYGYEGDEFLVNDPFSNANSSKTWDFETLSKQIKQVWMYY